MPNTAWASAPDLQATIPTRRACANHSLSSVAKRGQSDREVREGTRQVIITRFSRGPTDIWWHLAAEIGVTPWAHYDKAKWSIGSLQNRNRREVRRLDNALLLEGGDVGLFLVGHDNKVVGAVWV